MSLPDAPLLPDAVTPPPPSGKKITPFRMFLLSGLSVLAVFLVWLFWPVRAPERALRGCLPEECVATVEMHAPAALNSGLLQRDFGARLQKLPAYPLIERLFRDRGVDLRTAGPDIGRQMQALDATVCGLRDCAALAFGVTLDADPQIAMLFSVDNFGATLIRGFCLFAPAADEGRCRRVHIPESLTNGEQVPDFFIAPVPGTRFFRVATAPGLLRRYRMESAPAAPSLYPRGRQDAVEVCVNLDGALADLAETLLPASAPARRAPGAAAGAAPVTAAARPGGHAYFWWEYEKFGGEIRMRLPGETPAAGTRLWMHDTPAPLPGLTVSCALPRESLDPPTLLTLLRMSPAAALLPEAEIRRVMPGVKQLAASAAGGFSLRVFPDSGQPNAALFWTVDNPATAQRATAAGLNQLLAATAPAGGDSLLGLLSPAALLQVRQSPGRLSVSAPLLPSLEMAFTPAALVPDNSAPEGSAPDGAAPNGATATAPVTAPGGSAVMGAGLPLPPVPQLRACPPQTLTAARLDWRYAPEIALGLGRTVRASLSAAKSLASFLGGLDQETMRACEETLDSLAAVLGSLQDLSLQARGQADPVHGGTVTVLTFEGTLRME